jgi:peptidoglycan biosynthesis protein MviN/MurJ (putative lipid II flippase)
MAVVGIGQTALLLAIVPSLAGAIASGNVALARSLFGRGVIVAWMAACVGLLAAVVAGPPGSHRDVIASMLGWLTCGFGLTAHVRAAVLATHGRFAAPVAMNALYPALLIVASVASDSPDSRLLVGAYTIASGLHMAGLMLLSVPKDRAGTQTTQSTSELSVGRESTDDFPWHTLLAGVAATLPSTVLPLSDVYWSTRLEDGTLSLMALGVRLTVPLCAFATSGLAYVTFPSIARTAATGSREQARIDVLRMGVAAFTIMAPIVAVGIALRMPALSLILTRGQFTAEHARQLGVLLPWYLLSIVGTGISNTVLRSLFVFEMGGRVAAIALVAVLFYAVGSGLILESAPTSISVLYALTWIGFAGAQVSVLSAGIPPTERRYALRATGVAAVAAALAGGLSGVLLYAWPTSPSLTMAASRLVVAAGVGFGTYALAVRRMILRW